MRSRCSFFFFNDTATTEIYTLSLHDALPIWVRAIDLDTGLIPADAAAFVAAELAGPAAFAAAGYEASGTRLVPRADRKSTRLNSSHSQISYAVFCLKKKKAI